MENFTYKAKDSSGKVRTGEIKATSKSEAKSQLSRMKLTPLSLKAQASSKGEEVGDTYILGKFLYRDEEGNLQVSLGNQLPLAKDIVIFTRQFATMLKSGVPMVQSLEILGRQQSSRFFSKAILTAKKSVEKGSTLSVAMAQFPEIFDSLYIAMIAAGEASGNLDVILEKLTSYINKSSKIKGQIKSALMYPLIVLCVALLVISALLTFVVPTFAKQYEDSDRELPEITQWVISLSNFFMHQWWVILLSGASVFIIVKLWLKTEKGKAQFDVVLLKVPVIGPLLKKIAVGRFCSTMASMLSSGVNILESLSICAASSGNKVIETFILNVRKGLEKGTTFAQPLSEGNLFPDLVVSMVTVGEATGSLDEMLEKVSEFYEEEVDNAVQGLLSMIEPIMIVVIGGIVGFIVIAMYLPIFDLAGGVD